ncbi:hypothetical protein BDV96DRAFT_582451 [Lophiotrema nucula]|uniref:N-acetyltransferase domain-containing protein n=1 Tax=Lophiotrema nucula TaxID=690887 RepID=A0A6A5YWV3_9PLEO|nr:hypothetical protein BDV96DRAFT_582451 [Lophiotrema nucula]
MATPPQFLVRDVETVDGDGLFIISTFDAALPFLDSIGSHEQWGSTPFSHQQSWVEDTLRQIRDAENYNLTANSKGERLHVFIVERQCPAQGAEVLGAHYRIAVDGRRFLSVGFAFVRDNWFPSYITSQRHLHIGDAEPGNIVYLEVMVTDSRVGSLRCGAGAALIRAVHNYSRNRGKDALYLDGWAGNEKKLIKYYDQQGFRVVDDFYLPRPHRTPWWGTLMRMDISE